MQGKGKGIGGGRKKEKKYNIRPSWRGASTVDHLALVAPDPERAVVGHLRAEQVVHSVLECRTTSPPRHIRYWHNRRSVIESGVGFYLI